MFRSLRLFSCIFIFFNGVVQAQDYSIVVANSISEDFSILKRLEDGKFQVETKPIDPTAGSDKARCQSPNSAKIFDGEIFLVCSLSHTIHVFDQQNLNLKRILPLGARINPWDITIKSKTEAYVSSYLQDQILVINPTATRKKDLITKVIDLRKLSLASDAGKPTLPRPQSMLLIGDFLYVAIANLNEEHTAGGPGYVAVIDTSSKSVQSVIQTTGKNTVNLYQRADALYILNAGTYQVGTGYIGDGSVNIFNLQTRVIEDSIDVGGAPMAMNIDSDGIAYLSNGKDGDILTFDSGTHAILPHIEIPKNICGRSLDQQMVYISSLRVENKKLYLTEFNSSCFIILDTIDQQVTQEYKLGDGPILNFVWERN